MNQMTELKAAFNSALDRLRVLESKLIHYEKD